MAKKQKKQPAKQRQKSQKPKGSAMGMGKMMSIPSAVVSSMPKSFFRSVASTIPGAVRFQGCEVVRKLTSKQVYTQLANNAANPGNLRFFPRLSAVAVAFETFTWKSFTARFAPSAATSLSGTVGLMLDYDPTDALAPNIVQFLANETAVAGPCFAPLEVRADLKKLPYEKYFVSANQALFSSFTPSLARQNVPFMLKSVADNCASSDQFIGYLVLEYDIELYNAKPPTPTSLTAETVMSVAVGAGGNIAPPANQIDSGEGIVAGESDAVSAAYNTAGGTSNVLDGLKAIYEAGTWLIDTYSEWTGAAITDVPAGTLRPLRREPLDRSMIVIDEEKSGAVESGKVQRRYLKAEDAALAAPLALGSGDVQIDLEAYDVTAPNVIDPSFPVSVTSMTLVDTVSLVLSLGVGATKFPSARTLVVPAGKNYMWRPKFTLGPTTGRTLLTNKIAASAVTDVDI